MTNLEKLQNVCKIEINIFDNYNTKQNHPDLVLVYRIIKIELYYQF
jgi:hypothetical protein